MHPRHDKRSATILLDDSFLLRTYTKQETLRLPFAEEFTIVTPQNPSIMSNITVQPLPSSEGSSVDFGAIVSNVNIENISGKI